jgi:hypothetical protein
MSLSRCPVRALTPTEMVVSGCRGFVIAFLPICSLLGGCSPSSSHLDEPHHRGPKINLRDFISHTAAYKGKSITLVLKVDEAIKGSQGQSSRSLVGRNVKFATIGPKGEMLNITIAIPENLSVPEVGIAEEVLVTFVCTRGSLRDGNEAKIVERP